MDDNQLDYNLITSDTADTIRRLANAGPAVIPRGGGSKVRAQAPRENPNRTFFRNDSGETIPAFGLMAVTGAVVSTFRSYYIVTKPSATFQRKYLVNGPRSVAYVDSGHPTYGMAQEGAIQRVLYNSGTPAADEGFGPTPGQWYATKNYPQTCLVHGVWDSTAKIMLATLGTIDSFVGKPSGSIALDTTGTINLYSGTFPLSSLSVISSYTISACNVGPAVTTSDYVDVGFRQGQAVFSKICH